MIKYITVSETEFNKLLKCEEAVRERVSVVVQHGEFSGRTYYIPSDEEKTIELAAIIKGLNTRLSEREWQNSKSAELLSQRDVEIHNLKTEVLMNKNHANDWRDRLESMLKTGPMPKTNKNPWYKFW